MIPTVEEPKDLQKTYGVLENCFFCKKPTRYWHWRTNQPVCISCSKQHKVSELHMSSPNYKPLTKTQYLL